MRRQERPISPDREAPGKGDLSEGEYIATVEAGLIDRTRILASLDLRRGIQSNGSVGPESLVLTESHIMHVSVGPRQRNASIVAVRDVSVARVESERRGPGEYVWGALAVILGFLLWRVVEHPIASIAVGIAVAAMGVYLIADKIFRPITSVVVLLSEDGQHLRCDLRGGKATADVYEFISRIYERKAEIASSGRFTAGSSRRGEGLGRYSNRVTRSGRAGLQPRDRG